MAQFERERMIACYMSIGAMQEALRRTVEYLRERHAFGAPLLANQRHLHPVPRRHRLHGGAVDGKVLP
jgi:alkylation response protein AidB-like acyl-CoA dehydrogenase